MARYVNVEEHCEKLMKRIEELKVKAEAAESQRNHPLAEELLNEADNLLTAVILLRQIPEADVEEVRHGHWIHGVKKVYQADNSYSLEWVTTCSECGKELPGDVDPHYCEDCGAKMYKDEENDDAQPFLMDEFHRLMDKEDVEKTRQFYEFCNDTQKHSYNKLEEKELQDGKNV